MKIEIEIDVTPKAQDSVNDGQIACKLPKEDEIRWLVLNKRHRKELSKKLRECAFKIMEVYEAS